MSNTTNAGLAFYRYYFDSDYQLPGPYGASRSFDLAANMRGRNSTNKGKKDAADTKAVTFFGGRNKHLYDFRPDTKKQDLPFAGQMKNEYVDYVSFSLETSYPGLLIGTGYSHQSGAKETHILGFFFDHTTGMPVIPGSSIKGAIRAVFPLRDHLMSLEATEKADRYQHNGSLKKEAKCRDEAGAYEIYAKNKEGYLLDLCERIGIGIDRTQLYELERELFESSVLLKDENGEDFHAHITSSQRMVFADAHLTEIGKDGLLGPDFITPHKNTKDNGIPDRYVNPLPISFLKVMPANSFTFSFRLPKRYRYSYATGKQHWKDATLAPGDTEMLIKHIILEQGLGAKTRVGYGAFTSADQERPGVANDRVASNIDTNKEAKEILGEWKANYQAPDASVFASAAEVDKSLYTDAKPTSQPAPTPVAGPSSVRGQLDKTSGPYLATVLDRTKSKAGKRLEFHQVNGKSPFQNYRESNSGELSAYAIGDILQVEVFANPTHANQPGGIKIIKKI